MAPLLVTGRASCTVRRSLTDGSSSRTDGQTKARPALGLTVRLMALNRVPPPASSGTSVR
eukprot:scaffold262014_cov31-Tisochrysis_lutea.AAC.3